MELLKVAKATVPDTLWSSTPLMLRATAGLRLLPGEKANILLDEVRAKIQCAFILINALGFTCFADIFIHSKDFNN